MPPQQLVRHRHPQSRVASYVVKVRLGLALPQRACATYERTRPFHSSQRSPTFVTLLGLVVGSLPLPERMSKRSEEVLPSNAPFEVMIHADESCLGNQFMARANPGGAAGLVEFWTGNGWIRCDYWISESDTTNNRMAIRSAIEGIRGLSRPYRVRFVSDSQYLVKGMTEWLPKWKERGWKRKGGAIENLGLWTELDREAERHLIEWCWVRGHVGHPRNEYADDLAVRAARCQDTSGGFQKSAFEKWLQGERDERTRYLDFSEFDPPGVVADGTKSESG